MASNVLSQRLATPGRGGRRRAPALQRAPRALRIPLDREGPRPAAGAAGDAALGGPLHRRPRGAAAGDRPRGVRSRPSTWSRPARSAAARSTGATSTAGPAPAPPTSSAGGRRAGSAAHRRAPGRLVALARALIIGCGCRGRELGERLLAAGWAVRGTSRREEGLAAIEAAGIEPALADPDRVGTVLELVGDVAVVFHLLGSAAGEPEARRGDPRAAAGAAAGKGRRHAGAGRRLRGGRQRRRRRCSSGGAEIVRAASRTWRIPVEVVGAEPNDPGALVSRRWRMWLWACSPPAGESQIAKLG